MRRAFVAIRAAILTVVLVVAVVGCDDFDRQTYQTLAASQKVINDAATEYKVKVIPNNECAYRLINRARSSQDASASAFQAYYQMAQFRSSDAAQGKAALVAQLVTLAQVVVDVQALVKSPTTVCPVGTGILTGGPLAN